MYPKDQFSCKTLPFFVRSNNCFNCINHITHQIKDGWCFFWLTLFHLYFSGSQICIGILMLGEVTLGSIGAKIIVVEQVTFCEKGTKMTSQLHNSRFEILTFYNKFYKNRVFLSLMGHTFLTWKSHEIFSFYRFHWRN